MRRLFGLVAVMPVAALALLTTGCREPAPLPSGYAIVYGVSDYLHLNDLGQPDDDATAVAAMLAEEGYTVISGGPRVDIDATYQNLSDDFTMVSELADEDSRFVFYFAGHGFGDGMTNEYGNPPISSYWESYLTLLGGYPEPFGAGPYQEFIFLYEANPYAPLAATVAESLSDPIVSDDELRMLLQRVPSREKTVIIDACHSGGFLDAQTSVDTVPQAYAGSGRGISVFDGLNAMSLYFRPESVADIPEDEAIVLSAAGEQEFSYEGSDFGLPNGVFTNYLLEARDSADANYDGLITTSEIYAYAADRIEAVANQELYDVYKFLPRESGGAIDFVLFRAR